MVVPLELSPPGSRGTPCKTAHSMRQCLCLVPLHQAREEFTQSSPAAWRTAGPDTARLQHNGKGSVPSHGTESLGDLTSKQREHVCTASLFSTLPGTVYNYLFLINNPLACVEGVPLREHGLHLESLCLYGTSSLCSVPADGRLILQIRWLRGFGVRVPWWAPSLPA